MDKIKAFFKRTGSLFKSDTGSMIFVAVAGIILGALLFGGGKAEAPVEPVKEPGTIAEQTAQPDQQAEAPKDNSKGSLGKYDVEILDWHRSKNYEDKECIVIRYSYTNNSEDPQAFEWTIHQQAFQNGVQLDVTYIDGETNFDKEIMPGYTAEVFCAFVLQDNSPVTAMCEELISLNNARIEKEFALE